MIELRASTWRAGMPHSPTFFSGPGRSNCLGWQPGCCPTCGGWASSATDLAFPIYQQIEIPTVSTEILVVPTQIHSMKTEFFAVAAQIRSIATPLEPLFPPNASFLHRQSTFEGELHSILSQEESVLPKRPSFFRWRRSFGGIFVFQDHKLTSPIDRPHPRMSCFVSERIIFAPESHISDWKTHSFSSRNLSFWQISGR
jgi:hypothetical protein